MNHEYSVVVVGACVMLLPSADNTADYDDLINSVLLSQLAASQKVKKTPSIDWFDAYLKLMDNYWLRYSRMRQDWFVNDGDVESIGEWINGAISNNEKEYAAAAVTTLQQLAQLSGAEPVMALLRAHMQTPATEPDKALAADETIRLLVIVASTPTCISSVFVQLKTHVPVEPNPFDQRFEAQDVQGSVSLRYAKASLSETLYKPVREAIASKVADKHEPHVLKMTQDW